MLSALAAQAGTLEGPGDLERTMLALRACGAPAGALAGKDLLSGLLRYRSSDGSFESLVNITAFAIFALRADGRPATDAVIGAAGRWIAHHQDGDGGYSFAGGGSSDVDDTAAALQGLIDAGIRTGPSVSRAVAFIEHAQNPDGGFPAEPHQESNAQSTAWAVQGLAAAGVHVQDVRDRGSRSPLGYIESLVAPNGSVRYSRTSSQIARLGHRRGARRACARALPRRTRELRADTPDGQTLARWIHGLRVRAPRPANRPPEASTLVL